MRRARGMLASGVLVGVLAGAVSLGAAQATSAPKAAIEQAAAAPFRDVLLRDAHGLCADLTPGAGAELVTVPAAAPGSSCEAAVAAVFAAVAPPNVPAGATVTEHATAQKLTVMGSHARGAFSLISEVLTEGGDEIGPGGVQRLTLERIGRRWLVSSPARLMEVPDCTLNPPDRCRPGVQRLVFVIGASEPAGLRAGIPVPTAVRRAGATVMREFEAGASVVAQTGCLACHEIGKAGNKGPGPNLTHVGTRLDAHRLERALISPSEPMPSFRNLPRRKLRAIVRFLELLR